VKMILIFCTNNNPEKIVPHGYPRRKIIAEKINQSMEFKPERK